ncbi:MAG: L,D-transpeptidase [Thermoplasmata archaeon]
MATSDVAQLEVFDEPAAPQPGRVLANPTQLGAPLVLLVRKDSGPWLEVSLPVRPNGTTGWVRRSDVSLSYDPYHVDVHLTDHQIVVSKGSDVVLDAPIGVGTCDTPTPGGAFFLDVLMKPPSPGGPYGDYAYGLSGFSDALTTFEGGPAIIGIHGTNDPASVGQDESHGCIRMNNQDIDKLVPFLPLGTPVSIDH